MCGKHIICLALCQLRTVNHGSLNIKLTITPRNRILIIVSILLSFFLGAFCNHLFIYFSLAILGRKDNMKFSALLLEMRNDLVSRFDLIVFFFQSGGLKIFCYIVIHKIWIGTSIHFQYVFFF